MAFFENTYRPVTTMSVTKSRNVGRPLNWARSEFICIFKKGSSIGAAIEIAFTAIAKAIGNGTLTEVMYNG